MVSLYEATTFALSRKNQALMFLSSDVKYIFIAVFLDESFAPNRGRYFQFGLVVPLMSSSRIAMIYNTVVPDPATKQRA